MYALETTHHRDVKERELIDIIKIKTSAWNYPVESQLQWMRKNIHGADIHCLLKEEGRNIAYLNLVDIAVEIDGVRFDGYGVGNVCSVERGKGYGSVLMERVGFFIKRHTRVGMLFCKHGLVKFYSRFGWEQVPAHCVSVSADIRGIEVMAYNIPTPFGHIAFNGNLF